MRFTVWPRPIWINSKTLWQILPQYQSTYLRGPKSASIEIPLFRPPIHKLYSKGPGHTVYFGLYSCFNVLALIFTAAVSLNGIPWQNSMNLSESWLILKKCNVDKHAYLLQVHKYFVSFILGRSQRGQFKAEKKW